MGGSKKNFPEAIEQALNSAPRVCLHSSHDLQHSLARPRRQHRPTCRNVHAVRAHTHTIWLTCNLLFISCYLYFVSKWNLHAGLQKAMERALGGSSRTLQSTGLVHLESLRIYAIKALALYKDAVKAQAASDLTYSATLEKLLEADEMSLTWVHRFLKRWLGSNGATNQIKRT